LKGGWNGRAKEGWSIGRDGFDALVLTFHKPSLRAQTITVQPHVVSYVSMMDGGLMTA